MVWAMRITMLLFVLVVTVCARATPEQLQIVRLNGTVKVDGDLSDEAWKNARRVETFVEYFKGDNTAPPAPTVGYIGYDDAAVYVAFHNADPAPQSIRAPLVDRDKVMGDQDYVAILIDTQNDRRSGVAFRVNPRGVQTDSVVNDSIGEEDFSPDFFYEAVARRTANGWSAEMRIPLSSLRYPSRDPQTWGVILMRNYPRDFRYIMANTNIPKNTGCFLCHASTLIGLTGLPSASHFTLTPYAASSHERGVGTTQENDLGFDLKWKPSTKLTLDATLNPDFSQIEADVPQLEVNNRFALAYPEKRTFFLEGTDLLNTPIKAVYTRSITAPAWGLRATGTSGPNAYTFLLAQDRGGGSVVLPGRDGSEFAPQDFRSHVAVGRLQRSIGESFLAMMLTARESEGAHNRVLGPDFLWRRNATDKLHGQLLFTSTQNPNRPDLSAQFNGQSFDGHAYRVYFTRDAKTYDIWAATSGYSEGFRVDNGFVTQTNLRRAGLWLGRRYYPTSFFSYLRPYSGVEADTAFDGSELLRRGFFQGLEFQGKWGSSGWITAQSQKERVGGKLLRRDMMDFSMRAAPYRSVPAIQLDGEIGDRIDYVGAQVGSGARFNLSGTLRATDHLELQLMTTREWLDLETTGRLFTANVDWVKVTYTFSPRTLMRVIGLQSEVTRSGGTRDRRTSLSALYAYRLNWQTVFFAGFGDAGANGDPLHDTQSVFMKVSYAVQR
jgi:Domain of unknown function (DUF5916)